MRLTMCSSGSWQALVTTVLACSAVCANDSEPPSLTVKPRPQQAKSNSVASFFCGARGDPRPTIQWRKNNKRVSDSLNRYEITDKLVGSSETGSVLRIEPTRAHRDNAVYECFAENGVGDAVSANAKLEVFDDKDLPVGFPVITEGPGSHKSIEVGHNAVLQCLATGNPPPTIYWLRENMRLDLDTNPRYSILDKGFPGALQISDSQETDQGKYECVAENSVGTQHAQAIMLWVRVRRVPPQFSIPPPTMEKVKIGENISIPCVAVGSPMPYVKWRRGKTTELSPEGKLPVGRNVLNLTNVEVSDNYTCIAASSLGMIEATTFIKVLTLPSPPTDVKVSDVTSTSVKLSWSHPNPDDLQYYTISHKPRSASQSPGVISGVVTMYYTIRPLSPYTQYEFTVSAVNGFGHGPPSPPIVATTGETADLSAFGEGAKPGSAPRNIQVRLLSSSTMVIQWEEPETPNGQVIRYKVYYTTNPDQQLSSWNTMVVDNNQLTTINELTPLSIYTIRVQAFTSVGPGPLSTPVQVKMQQGVPSQPRDLRVSEIGETSIGLQWAKPNQVGEQILSYELYWNDTYAKEKHHRRIPVSETYSLTGLYPNTLYYVWLAAKSQRGEGAPTPPTQVRTKQYVPEAPPQNVTAEAVSPTSIVVQWQPPLSVRSNGQIVYYKVMAAESGVSDSEAEPHRVENVTSYALDDLKRWTEYKIWVLAGTAVGDGPSSYPITIRTREDERPTISSIGNEENETEEEKEEEEHEDQSAIQCLNESTSQTSEHAKSLSSNKVFDKKNNKRTTETASSTVMKYLLESKKNSQEKEKPDPVDAFLLSIGNTMKSFDPYFLNLAKSKIFNIVQEMEMQQIMKKQNTPSQINYTSSYLHPAWNYPPTATNIENMNYSSIGTDIVLEHGRDSTNGLRNDNVGNNNASY